MSEFTCDLLIKSLSRHRVAYSLAKLRSVEFGNFSTLAHYCSGIGAPIGDKTRPIVTVGASSRLCKVVASETGLDWVNLSPTGRAYKSQGQPELATTCNTR